MRDLHAPLQYEHDRRAGRVFRIYRYRLYTAPWNRPVVQGGERKCPLSPVLAGGCEGQEGTARPMTPRSMSRLWPSLYRGYRFYPSKQVPARYAPEQILHVAEVSTVGGLRKMNRRIKLLPTYRQHRTAPFDSPPWQWLRGCD